MHACGQWKKKCSRWLKALNQLYYRWEFRAKAKGRLVFSWSILVFNVNRVKQHVCYDYVGEDYGKCVRVQMLTATKY